MHRYVIYLAVLFWFAGVTLSCDDSADIEVSCAGSLTHYYDVGCAYTDIETGVATPVSEMVAICQAVRSQGTAECQPALDDWLICSELADGTADGCDCNAAFDRALQAGCAY